jgi:streptogramin lyase
VNRPPATASPGPAGADPVAGLLRIAEARPGADTGLIRRAYQVAAHWHHGQRRNSGEPYVSHPLAVAMIAAGAGAVWAASLATDTVVRIDPAANAVVDAFPSGGLAPQGIAVGDGYVWVANHHGNPTGSVAKIDPATDTLIDVIPVGAASFTGGPGFLAAVPGSVWAGVPNQSTVLRINTATDAISATIPVHGACGEVAADSQQVCVSGGTRPGCFPGLSLVNPATNSMVTHLTAGGPSSGNALGTGGFWFGAGTSDLLNRVDTATNSLAGQLKLPGSPVSIATGFGSVWVADQTNSAVLRVAHG